MTTTEPETWARLCDNARGPGFVFRRGIELGLARSLSLVTPGCRWLDVGCGPGQLIRRLREAGVAAVGIDADPRMIAFARQRMSPPHALAVARAEQLPFGADTIDGVVATSLMGCLDDAAPACAEFWRVLRPGGVAVITFTNRDSWLLRLNYALSRRRGGGYRLYSADQPVSALEALGFEVVEVRFYGVVFTAGSWTFPPAVLARWLEGSRPTWLLTRLARNFIVVLRKRQPGAAT